MSNCRHSGIERFNQKPHNPKGCGVIAAWVGFVFEDAFAIRLPSSADRHKSTEAIGWRATHWRTGLALAYTGAGSDYPLIVGLCL
jgi:hypothetical protein